MEQKVFADDMEYNNFSFRDLFVPPIASKKNRQAIAQNLERGVNTQIGAVRSVGRRVGRGLSAQADVLQTAVKSQGMIGGRILGMFGGLTLAERIARENKRKSLSAEQTQAIIEANFGSPNQETGIFSRISKAVLKKLQNQAREKKQRELALEKAKTQSEMDALRQQIQKLKADIESTKQELQQKSQVPAPQVERIVENIENQPQVKIETQIEEVASQVVDEATSSTQEGEQSPVIEKPTAIKQAGLPKWLLPALIIGGVAYFVMRKK
jgi:hypothetical protein